MQDGVWLDKKLKSLKEACDEKTNLDKLKKEVGELKKKLTTMDKEAKACKANTTAKMKEVVDSRRWIFGSLFSGVLAVGVLAVVSLVKSKGK